MAALIGELKLCFVNVSWYIFSLTETEVDSYYVTLSYSSSQWPKVKIAKPSYTLLQIKATKIND